MASSDIFATGDDDSHSPKGEGRGEKEGALPVKNQRPPLEAQAKCNVYKRSSTVPSSAGLKFEISLDFDFWNLNFKNLAW
jgi:hypothetical protein